MAAVETIEPPIKSIFVVGKRNQTYDGYRKVTEQDISTIDFQKEIIRCHNKYNGFPVIDFISYKFNKKAFLCVGNGLLELNKSLIFDTEHGEKQKSKPNDPILIRSIEKNGRFVAWNSDTNIPFGKNWRIKKYECDIDAPTLFVLTDFDTTTSLVPELDTSLDPIAVAYQHIAPETHVRLIDLLDAPYGLQSILAGIPSYLVGPLSVLESVDSNPRLNTELTTLTRYNVTDYPPFKVGLFVNEYEYDGYRRMTNEEFLNQEWQKALLHLHRMNDGWPLFEDLVIKRPLCVEFNEIQVNYSYLVHKGFYTSNNKITDKYKAFYEDDYALSHRGIVTEKEDGQAIFGTEKDTKGNPLPVNEYKWEAYMILDLEYDWTDTERPCLFVYEHFNPIEYNTSFLHDTTDVQQFGTKKYKRNSKKSYRNRHKPRSRSKNRF